MTRARLVAALAATALAAAGCGGSSSDSTTTSSSPPPAATTPPSTTPPGPGSGGGSSASAGAESKASVPIRGFKFVPATIKLKAGGTITWTNHDSTAHTATAKDGSFNTGTLNEGQSKTITFRKPGTYAYVCAFHKFMQGTVVVVAG
jgi:plastocyanin